MIPPDTYRIGFFISPHGFGHAARAAAVMEALYQRDSSVRFELFTQIPAWFFEDSFSGTFGYHALLTDIGLAQKNSLAEDLPETVSRLNNFLPFEPDLIRHLADQITELNCRLIMCDIAPLGVAVARAAGIPSVLIENFTWDWIYEGYLPHDRRLQQHITYLQQLFNEADYHIQTEPVCRPSPRADLTTPPVSRRIRTPARQVRAQLGIPHQAKIVLLTMGGVPWQYTFLEELQMQKGLYFVIPNGNQRRQDRHQLVLLPSHSSFFHPDLINAADVVIGKAGYSTLAEVYQAGVPYGFVPRPKFRETHFLVSYIKSHMNATEISDVRFQDGSWVAALPELLVTPRADRRHTSGADKAARFILEEVLPV